MKGLAPKPLDPLRYHVNPRIDLNELEMGMPWRNTQDELASTNELIMNTERIKALHMLPNQMLLRKQCSLPVWRMQHPVLSEKPDVTCPSDVQDSERRTEVVQHEEVPGHPQSKKKNSGDKKSSLTIKAKSIPVTPKTVAASTGSVREKWLLSIHKEIENFLQSR